jgi:muramoyltetrapeptide carboxypeptidase
MAHIYVLSTSTAVEGKDAFKRGIARLQALGHEVEVDEAALKKSQRFAGDDDTRLAAILRACASQASVVLGSRGGYGVSRLLHRLPYAALGKSLDRGTLWMGYSDWTALQFALISKRGLGPQSRTWQSAMVMDDFAPEKTDEITQAFFADTLEGINEGAGWRLPARDRKIYAKDIAIHKAALWGGNLCMVASLLGTPYMPAIQKGVLWVEDIGEHPYKVERMLISLLHAGVLAQQKAIVLAQFSRTPKLPNDRGYTMNTVADWLRSQLKIPVLTGMPFGHVSTKLCLPQGASCSLSVADGDALIYWG